MVFKMKGSSFKMGTIKGTSGHVSALKQVDKITAISKKEDEGLSKYEQWAKIQGDLENIKKVWPEGNEKARIATMQRLRDLNLDQGEINKFVEQSKIDKIAKEAEERRHMLESDDDEEEV